MESTDEQPGIEAPYIPHPAHKAQESKAIMVLLFFSFLMITLPFGVFFSTKYILIDYGITGFDNVIWTVAASVLTVNLIIGGYVYIAFKEPELDAEGRPVEEKSKSD